ncbi:hypothetical protein CR513_43857, partial [Mucuna pruriens]
SNPSKLHACDPEIDRTFHRLLRSPKSSEVVNSSSYKSSVFASDSSILISNSADFDFNIVNYDSGFFVDTSQFSLDNMVDNNKTLKELTTPNIMCQPWCEDPHKHLKEFHSARNLISNMAESLEIPTTTPFRQQQPMQFVQQNSLEDLVKQMATSNIHFEQNVAATIQDLQTQIGQFTTIVTQLCRILDIARTNIVGVMEVIAVQPPLPYIVHSLQPLVITANKLQVEQKERLLLGLINPNLIKKQTLIIGPYKLLPLSHHSEIQSLHPFDEALNHNETP